MTALGANLSRSTPRFCNTFRMFGALILCMALVSACRGDTAADREVIWSIGKADGSSIEFAPGSPLELIFKIGESDVSKDFAGMHEGTISWMEELNGEKPYSVEFDLPEGSETDFELVLQMLFKNGAPTQMEVIVNERRGIFPIVPVAAKPVDSSDGNFVLLAKQELIVAIPNDWLKPSGNRITLVPQGFGTLHYDSLQLRRAAEGGSAVAPQPLLHPTVFYVTENQKLLEVCHLLIPFQSSLTKGAANIQLGDQKVHTDLEAGDYQFGVLAQSVRIPALEAPTEARIEVDWNGTKTNASHVFQPARRWKLFFCPKVHNDVGYTDIQPHVNELDTRNTDTILSILDKFPFYKFNFETSWLVQNYLDCRTEPAREELLRQAREGRAAINAFYLNIMTGICTGEELHRSMYYTHELHRQHGSNFDYACLTDAPSHSWYLPTLLSDVGIKGFANGSNQGRAPILVLSDMNENSPFYWEGVNGERILMFYARVYAQWKMLTCSGFIGPTASYEYLKGTIPQMLLTFMRDDYLPDAVMIYGAYIDNAAIPETGEGEFIARWNEEFAYPRLMVTTDAEYFDYIDKHYSDRLPTYRGDAGAYWEDGVASSAEATAINRRTQQILPLAETSSSIATLFEPKYRYPREGFRSAWQNLLFYDEHTWGAFNSTTQPDREGVGLQWEIKESYARQANLDARNLLARSLNRLCQQFNLDDNIILAFNWQNRARSQVLETELGTGSHLVDLVTGQPVPLDVIRNEKDWQRVRFVAKDVPAMGYRGYAVRLLDPNADPFAVKEAEEDVAPEEASLEIPTSWIIENEHYRLELDPQTGGVLSLVDKAESRELADKSAASRLNQYLYVSGGDESLILDFQHGKQPAELTINTADSVTLVENKASPLGQRIVVTAQAKHTPMFRSEYSLFDHEKRIDIVNTVQKESVRDKEAVYFAFPFAAKNPELEYQIQNCWVRPNQDQLPGACREWFSTQNLAHLRDDGYSVAWASPDAPLVTFEDINRGLWLRELKITKGHLFSYVMNNYWWTNYRADQGGEFTFRYSITSGRDLSREDLAEFDADTRTPVQVYPYLATFSAGIKQKDRRLEASSGSFLELDQPNLQVVVMKQAEDGDGWILRLQEVGGKSGTATLRLPSFPLESAHLCNSVEVNQRPLEHSDREAQIPFEPNRFVTVRLKLGAPHD